MHTAWTGLVALGVHKGWRAELTENGWAWWWSIHCTYSNRCHGSTLLMYQKFYNTCLYYIALLWCILPSSSCPSNCHPFRHERPLVSSFVDESWRSLFCCCWHTTVTQYFCLFSTLPSYLWTTHNHISDRAICNSMYCRKCSSNVCMYTGIFTCAYSHACIAFDNKVAVACTVGGPSLYGVTS